MPKIITKGSTLYIQLGFLHGTQRRTVSFCLKTEFQTIGLTYVSVRCCVPFFLSGTHCLNVVEVLGRKGICQSVLLALIVNTVLNDAIWQVVNWLWDPLKLDFSHFNWSHQQLSEHPFELIFLLPVLPQNQLVHSVFNTQNGINVVFDINGYLGHFFVYSIEFSMNLPDIFFSILPFLQYMVVTFVLL